VAIAVPNMEKAVAFYKNALNAKSISEKHVI
jgi:catechol 2,3-dioxygenase-like lactoylglutathione lyase family enzyme